MTMMTMMTIAVFSTTSQSLNWRAVVPQTRYLSLPASQTRLETGEPDMKVAKVAGEGEELQTLTNKPP